MQSVYNEIIGTLKTHNIAYREYDHEPILNYEDAEREKQRLGWNGIESKNVFMSGKDGKYYLYVTTQGQKVDFKQVKELTGTNCSMANEEAVRNIIQCVPGCVAPFGFGPEIVVILDRNIFKNTDYLFSPGVTTKTIQLNVQDLAPIFASLPNRVIEVNQ